MQPSNRAVAQKIHLQSANFVLRTMEIADADRDWGRWLADPLTAHMLNAMPKALSLEERTAYVRSFDSRACHLLGIFEKARGEMVGFWSIYVDERQKAFLLNVLVGSVERRHHGAVKETRHLLYRHFFETLGMERAQCSVAAQNKRMIDFLLANCWKRTGMGRSAAASGSSEVDIHLFELTREAWRQRAQGHARPAP